MFTQTRKQSRCHPDKEHKARGLCHACYAKQYRIDVPRDRRSYNRMPGPKMTDGIPVRAAGVQQHAVTAFPIPECPHCHNRVLMYVGREVRCPGMYAGCGWTGYLVRDGAAG